MDTKLINKIKRQMTLKESEMEDMAEYDKIVDMEWDGIPALEGKAWYIPFKDPTGRDLVQQAVNIYATQDLSWDILPIGANDEDNAQNMEAVIDWYMKQAGYRGRVNPFTEALVHVTKYNKVCGQLEWDGNYPCIKNYNPQTVWYEYGKEINWVAVVENVSAVNIVEHWESFRSDKKIDAALKKIEGYLEDDEEQLMMYIDYTDKKRRFVYCYKWEDEALDDSLGVDDDGKVVVESVIIQDKENSLGFINWAIAESEGDPLLAPLHKGGLWLNTNRSETIKRSIAYRSAFPVMLIEEGTGEDAEVDYSGDFPVLRVPPGKRITQAQMPPLDPAFNELSVQDRNMMTNSVGIGQTASLQAANVQFATINALIQLKLAQLDPYKKTVEKYGRQMGYLLFKWMKKDKRTLVGRKYKGEGEPMKARGAEVVLHPEDIDLDSLFIECELLPNNPTDVLQRVNAFMTMRQGGAPISWKEIFKRLHLDGEFSYNDFTNEEVQRIALEAFKAKMMQNVQLQGQAVTMQMQAGIQQQQMQQQAQLEAQAQQNVPQQANQPQAIQGQAQGLGFDAGMGGMSPNQASPSMTQTQGNADVTGAGAG